MRHVRSTVCAARQPAEAHVGAHGRPTPSVPRVFPVFLGRVGDATSLRGDPRARRALPLRDVRQAVPAPVVGAVAPHAARWPQAAQLQRLRENVHASVRLASSLPRAQALRPRGRGEGGRWRRQQGGRAETRRIHRLPH